MKTPIALIALAVAMWLLKGLLEPLHHRVGQRLAQWAMPTGQAWTFRIARAIVVIARAVAPPRELRVHPSPKRLIAGAEDPWEHGTVVYLCGNSDLVLAEREYRWASPDAAWRELEADAATSRPVANPIRLAAPLLRYAVILRLRNLQARWTSGMRRDIDRSYWAEHLVLRCAACGRELGHVSSIDCFNDYPECPTCGSSEPCVSDVGYPTAPRKRRRRQPATTQDDRRVFVLIDRRRGDLFAKTGDSLIPLDRKFMRLRREGSSGQHHLVAIPGGELLAEVEALVPLGRFAAWRCRRSTRRTHGGSDGGLRPTE